MAYAQMTPALRARGIYKVREPFAVADNVNYTCIAIRSFKDIYREGKNPYTVVYLPVGLTDGTQTSDGSTFSFANEELIGINIITLCDDHGNSILVPDNYIIGYPSESGINYREYFLVASMGALPVNTDTTDVTVAVTQAIYNAMGTNATVNTHTLAILTTPTYEQHLAYEVARNAAVLNANTDAKRIAELETQVTALTSSNEILIQILKDNNLFDQVIVVEE